MLGDAPEIVDGLALSHEDRSTARWAPQLTVGYDLDTGRDHSLGIDWTATWYADSIDATSTTPIHYRARRDVIPVSTQLRLAVGGKSSRFVFAAGPTLALSRFEESGWLGDGTQTKPALGGAFSLGGRTEVSDDIRFSYLCFIQGLHLPAKNALLNDGGGTWMGGVTVGFDFGL